jgi:pumilio RNA-binding family
LSREINGNHVLVKILQSWSSVDKQFIFDKLVAKCVQISCHKHGCCLM